MAGPAARDEFAEKVLDQSCLAASGLSCDADHQAAPPDRCQETFAQDGSLSLVANRASPTSTHGRELELLRRHPFPGGRLESQAVHQFAERRLGRRAELLAH